MKSGKVVPGEVSHFGDSTALSAEKKKAQLEAQERRLQEERLEVLIQEAMQQQKELTARNNSIQKKIALVLQKKTQEMSKAASSEAQTEEERDESYSGAMNACTTSRETLKRIREDYEKLSSELGSQLGRTPCEYS